ncbi:MAG: PEP-CTERM sorting domain-containing protein [Planctomycetota bacterium]|jgi:hypothetical protein
MRKIAVISSLVLLLSITGADADIVELPLGADGRYDVNSEPWEMDFDLGVTFTDISHVYIDWSGEIMAGLAVDPMRPGPQPFPLDVGLLASLGRNPGSRITDVYGGEATYPEPEGFDSRSEFELSWSTTWSDLLDGQGTIAIDYTVLGGPYVAYVESGFVDLSSVTLVVEGTPVPEPATLFLVAFGAVMMRKKR